MTLKLNKTHLIVFIVGAILGLVSGFFIGKGIYDRPMIESVTRDTVRTTDTIPHYYPQPVDGTVVRYITKLLPVVKTDTFVKTDVKTNVITCNDTVAVEVPITSKHYSSKDYDAWVSGYEPSLDSIKVYSETQYVTEVRTISKTPNKWELDLVGGVDYNTNGKKYTPHIGGELLYKPNRLQVGVRGGVEYNDKVEPVIGAVVKLRIL